MAILNRALALAIQQDAYRLELKKLQSNPKKTKEWRRKVVALSRAIEDTHTQILQCQPGRNEDE